MGWSHRLRAAAGGLGGKGVIGFAGLGVAAALLALPASQAQTSPAARPALSDALRAKTVVCAGCHGSDGHANVPDVPHLAGQPRLFIENRLVMIREGLSVVPSMKGMLDGMTDEDLIALSHVYAAMPLRDQRPARDATKAARGAAVSQRTQCGSCHLSAYQGQQQVPRLSGQREDYLLKSMRDFAAGRTGGRDTQMSNALLGLTDSELGDLAHHLATVPAAKP